MKQTDHFLAEDLKSRGSTLGYWDGFRFGFGFFMALVAGSTIVGGLGYILAKLLHWL